MPNVRTLTISSSTFDSSAIRQETWNGKEYTVVPVIAIVEGVLYGANATTPEFASSTEFGKFPEAWNGRPVVLNHPQIDGIYVSAGSPQVLEQYQMGFMFNTTLDGTKLKTEAWLDNVRITELGGTFQETLDRINAGEIVEVSVGTFLDTIDELGTFNGKNYGARWANIAPDHLAILEKGLTGACSVKDGCGTRVFAMRHVSVLDTTGACCASCAEGGSCMASDHDHNHQHEQNPTQTEEPRVEEPNDTTEGGEEAGGEEAAEALSLSRRAELLDQLSVNSIDPSITLEDARKVVRAALQTRLGMSSYYDIDILAMTADHVVYHNYRYCDYSSSYSAHQLAYSVDASGNVSFTGDPEPVNVLVRIVPRQADESGISVNNERNDAMSGATGQGANTPASGGEGTGSAPGVNAAAPTFAELLAAADPATRGMFQQGIKAFNDRKDSLVQSILAIETNSFSEDALKAMDLDMLENLSTLAGVKSFAGRALPGEQEGISVNSTQTKGTRFATANTNFLGDKE